MKSCAFSVLADCTATFIRGKCGVLTPSEAECCIFYRLNDEKIQKRRDELKSSNGWWRTKFKAPDNRPVKFIFNGEEIENLYNNCKKEKKMRKEDTGLRTFTEISKVATCGDCEYLVKGICNVSEHGSKREECYPACAKLRLNFLPDIIDADCCNNCARILPGGCLFFDSGQIKEFTICKFHKREEKNED